MPLSARTHGGGDARIRHRDHEIGFHRRFARQLSSQLLAAGCTARPNTTLCRARKVTCSKIQSTGVRRWNKTRADSFRANDDQFSGSRRASKWLRLGQRRKSPRRNNGVAVWPASAGIRPWPGAGSRADHAAAMIRSGLITTSRKRTSTRRQRVRNPLPESMFARERDQVDDHFSIAISSEKSNPGAPADRGTSAAFTRLPLCATPIEAFIRLHQNRLSISSAESPAVE